MGALKPVKFKSLMTLNGCPNWTGLRSIIAISATRKLKHNTETEPRYFISNLDGNDPARLGKAVRAHWSVENNLHWVLDVAFDEDQNRIRVGNSAKNLAVIRHIALNLIKNENSSKVGVKTKRAKVGWNNQFFSQNLGNDLSSIAL